MPATLKIEAAHFTEKGRKDSNQDCLGARAAEAALLQTKGYAAVIADGVSSSEYGGEAAAACVRGFLADYFSTPETWSVKKSAQQIFTALNSWLYRQSGQRTAAHRGRVSTLSTIIFKSTTAHIFHIGDSRIYLMRQGSIEQLTVDHRTWISADKSYLSRAMGIDLQLQIDYKRLATEVGDIFIMSTDGLHDFVTERDISSTIYACKGDLNRAAQILVNQALQNDSNDNVSCQILRIDELPQQNQEEVYKQLTELPFPPELSEGMMIDGYKIVRELHASNRSQLYLALDTGTGMQVVLKTPSINFVDDAAYIDRFTMEEWVGRRIDNPHVLKIYEPTRRRRCLYHVAEFLPGQSLRQWMIDNPNPDLETIRTSVEQIAQGLQAFHRQDMLHQDLKPENIVRDQAGTFKIIDFGSVKVAGIAEIESPVLSGALLGTKNYTAPEYINKQAVGNGADIFSLGVICYEMFCGRLPFEEAPANWNQKHWQNLQYTPLTDYRDDVPRWVDACLKKAVNPDPKKRYKELSEFLYDLRVPNTKLLYEDHRPLLQKNPLRFWQSVSAILSLIVVALVVIIAY
ncbi:MAG: bifunctional protein-serine/threonine kinase/phosphatase [Pseudohongiellaceae bacterium]|nr:bifunctional protein-serine/threonine kinase/phosphatase [Pseudohongiellaceae bacterium]